MSEVENHDASDKRDGRYANYLEVGWNAFEFLLDFGQTYGDTDPRMHTRIVTGPAYAKAFLVALHHSVANYENQFGPIPDEDTP